MTNMEDLTIREEEKSYLRKDIGFGFT